MRVLLVQGTSAGGVGRHVAALARGLFAAGHDVVVAAPASAREALAIDGSGASFEPVEIGDHPRGRQEAAAVRRLRRLARGCDVVHAHGLRAGALAGIAVGPAWRPRGAPLVVTVHNLPVGGAKVQRISAFLERVVARRSAAVLGVSSDLVQRMLDRGARHGARALVPAPASPPSGPVEEVRAAIRAELGVPQGAALVVTIARLAPQKGYATWFDAIGLIIRDHPGLSFVVAVAGDGPLHGELAERARSQRLPVLLLGHRSDASDLLAAADVAVCASVWEGQPLVVQEALRCGAPLVATDVGGTAEVAGDAAVLVPYGDPGALASAVARLLQDPLERGRRRAAGLARAAGFPTDSDAVAQVQALYAEVVAGR